MSTPFAVAPQAPGSMGQDVPAEDLLAYLEALTTWRERRRVELDHLDEAAMRSANRGQLTGDVMLSMTLWKAVADRHDLLVSAWDSGRVIAQDRIRLTTLIWGRLDQDAVEGSSLAVSLPEACRLSDSLAASLRRALGLDGSEPGIENRVKELRASAERIRDLVAEVPATRATSAQKALVSLDRRLVDLEDRVRRGADVGGLVGPLEITAATTERDLIVAAANRTRARDRVEDVRATVADLAARGDAVRGLARRCVGLVADAPTLGVPDVAALGDPPTDPADLDAYSARLDRVGRALEMARSAYAGALERRDDLAGQLDRDAARVADLPPGLRPDGERLLARGREIAAATPTDLAHLGALTAALAAYLGSRR